MSVKDKIAKIRGMGHHVPVGLDDILEDLEKRIEALEPKAKETPETTVRLGPTPSAHDNPLDGTNLKS